MESTDISANLVARKMATEVTEYIMSEAGHLSDIHGDQARIRFVSNVRDTLNSWLPESKRLVKNAPIIIQDGAKYQSGHSDRLVWAQINMKCVNETDSAFRFQSDDRGVWIPKSQIGYGDSPKVGEKCVEVQIPEWLAVQKDLDF